MSHSPCFRSEAGVLLWLHYFQDFPTLELVVGTNGKVRSRDDVNLLESFNININDGFRQDMKKRRTKQTSTCNSSLAYL